MPILQPATDPASPESLMAHAIVEGIRSATLELPVMPRVAQRLFGLANDPDADTSDLSQLIHSDQTIAGHVLRIANSAAYGGGEPIVSLQQAVARLGMKLLGEIAIAVSIQSSLGKVKGYQAEIDALLKHALAAGAFGKEIARKRRRNVEGQFLCGLLHSVGKPLCYQLAAATQKRLGLAISRAETRRVVDALHGKIATKVALDWSLPKQLQVAIAFHARYEQAPGFKDEAAATYLSARFADWMFDSANHSASALAQDPVFEYLNFYPDDVQDLLDRQDDVKAVVSAMEL